MPAVQQIAYGCNADSLDEYCRLRGVHCVALDERALSVSGFLLRGRASSRSHAERAHDDRKAISSCGLSGMHCLRRLCRLAVGNYTKGLQGIMVGKDGVLLFA